MPAMTVANLVSSVYTRMGIPSDDGFLTDLSKLTMAQWAMNDIAQAADWPALRIQDTVTLAAGDNEFVLDELATKVRWVVRSADGTELIPVPTRQLVGRAAVQGIPKYFSPVNVPADGDANATFVVRVGPTPSISVQLTYEYVRLPTLLLEDLDATYELPQPGTDTLLATRLAFYIATARRDFEAAREFERQYLAAVKAMEHDTDPTMGVKRPAVRRDWGL